jgi:hypothetical protein
LGACQLVFMRCDGVIVHENRERWLGRIRHGGSLMLSIQNGAFIVRFPVERVKKSPGEHAAMTHNRIVDRSGAESESVRVRISSDRTKAAR